MIRFKDFKETVVNRGLLNTYDLSPKKRKIHKKTRQLEVFLKVNQR